MTGLFKRSRSEARQLAAVSNLTIEQVIHAAKVHANLPVDGWVNVDSALTQKHLRDVRQQRLVSFVNMLRSGIQAHKRLAITAAIILITFVLFALVPRGQTLAKGAFDYFANIFESKMKIEPTSEGPIYPEYVAEIEVDPGGTVNENGDVIIEFDDFETFSTKYGLAPVQLISDDFERVGITLTKYSTGGISLRSQYTSSDGDVVVTQKWLVPNSLSIGSNGSEWITVKILGDIELTYCIDETDGIFDGFATYDDTILWISAQPEVDILNELSNFIE